MILFPEINTTSINGGQSSTVDSSQKEKEKELFTKEQFTNSIMKALNKNADKLGESNISKFQAEASSIFNAYDTHNAYGQSGADSIWQESEGNQGSAKLAQFYQTVNNAIKGITDSATTESTAATTSTDPTETTSAVVQAGAITTADGTEISRAALNSVAQILKEGGAEALAQDIVSDIETLISQGNEVSVNGGIVTITDSDGNTEEINLNELISNGMIKNHVDSIADSWAQKGFSEVQNVETRNIDGKDRVVVTLQNPDTGETVEIFGDTGEQIKADVNTGTDS